MRLEEIARRLECLLEGPEDLEIRGVAGIEEAGPDQLTFLSNPKYRSKLKDCNAGAVLTAPGVETSIPRLVTDNPYLAFARAIEFFYQPPEVVPGIHPTAWVADSAELGEDHALGANVVIGEGVRVGRGAVLHPNVVIYPEAQIGDDFEAHAGAVVREHVRIGDRVTLQNGAVIGSDGFGFAPDAGGEYHKMVQSGVVILEDDVEIGANTCIDRATVGETRIEKGVKIDNLVQIGHGSRLGRDTVVAAQAGLAGSTKVGRSVRLAGQVGVAGHLTIGDEAVVTAQSGIGRSIEPGAVVSGSPEMDNQLWKKNVLLRRRFPDLFKTVRRLEKELEEMKRGRAAEEE
ncbi:MAG TPA: UDP-3-O-(3-hydroxymyristoyl)glucosamine N-acyltransferase [Acidobacteriota bacterium]|nr:UDP-3-O-(3-hydroxymyristoyl)glucosamine N-acyltransferase [Acidobacteriota bacterium]